MPERLLQLGFDAQFKPAIPQDVTPENFQGLGFEPRGSLLIPKPELARFVREVADPTKVTLAADAANYLIDHIYTPFEDFDQEEAWVLLLNTKNLITHEAMVYRGVVDSIDMRPAEVLKEAVRLNAPQIILSHVHPSGNPDPSPQDIWMTERLVQAARLLELELLDHIIVGKDCWVSMQELGLGFDS